MKYAGAKYPIWHQILWSCDERESPDTSYRLLAWLRVLIGYPTVVIPAFIFKDSILETARHPEFAVSVQEIWLSTHVFYFIASLVALVASLEKQAPRFMGLARSATLFCCILEVATTILFALMVGLEQSVPHFILFFLIVGYRTILPFRYGLAVGFTVFISVFGLFVGAYFFQTMIGSADALTYVTFSSGLGYVGGTLTNVSLIFMLFCAVNYIVNQRNILEHYLTESVLSRYLPPRLVAQASRGDLEFEHQPENRVITVLFADLVGFTMMSRELGSEGVAKIINCFISEVSELAHYHGGTIDKFIGDCVMVFFGAPDAMTPEAQAYRCTEMARQVQERVNAIDWGMELSVRIGVSTGEVVVGHFGSEVRSDYTVIGSAVNLAARLETVCMPGSVLVGEETMKLLGDSVVLKKVGPFSLKGVGDDIWAWEVQDI